MSEYSEYIGQVLRAAHKATYSFRRKRAPQATGKPLTTQALQTKLAKMTRGLLFLYPTGIDDPEDLAKARPRALMVACYEKRGQVYIRFYRRNHARSSRNADWTPYEQLLEL